MAKAPTVTTSTPKQIGRHLREVRRRKGLSLSEVARGAGLTRRELNAYEKGKIEVPDSDLFVIAGSCGVDVAELRPESAPLALEYAEPEPPPVPVAPAAMPSSIEDTVNLLRRPQPGDLPNTSTAIGASWQARALAAGAEPVEPAWPPVVESIDPRDAVQWPDDVGIAAPAAAAVAQPSPAEPVDVFAELARLPEPSPLPLDGDAHDLFTPPPEFAEQDAYVAPPPGAIEQIDEGYDDWSPLAGDDDAYSDETVEPVLVEMPSAPSAAEFTSAADAPPIDVVPRAESYASPWDTLALPRRDATDAALDSAVDAPSDAPFFPAPEPEPAMEPAPAWPIPGTVGNDATTDEVITPFDATKWSNDNNGTDAGTTTDAWAYAEEQPATGTWTDADGDTATADMWTNAYDDTTVADTRFSEWAPTVTEAAPAEPDTRAPWAHEPDPEATSTGFYVDWGEPEEVAPEPAPWEALAPPSDPSSFDAYPPVAPRPEPEPEPAFLARDDEQQAPPYAETYDTLDTVDAVDDDTQEPEPARDEPLSTISWRPQWDDTPAPVATAVAVAASAVVTVDEATVTAPEPQFVPEPAPVREEQFVVAGSEWELGNALPLVEVRSTGSLVMRRADERWALADVVAATDFALEVYVDFRSGPGFGVLFRAETDAEGRMSGYSFDIDPVYEGGGYLVREWKTDRELWNPIAHVRAGNPQELHGLVAVRLVVDNDRLVASVNGDEVLTVDSLKQASADRGREGAGGNRVGIQAWSSSDLVIDELRVAEH
jgi:transcriptional regulator with XRE-family HTH domain